MEKKPEQGKLTGISTVAAKPLIKWAGGKTRLLPTLTQIAEVAQSELNIKRFDYYEPFFGGGAYFFELVNKGKIRKAYINDIIPHLISFYQTVSKQQWLDEIFNEIKILTNEFENGNQKKVYGSIKQSNGWVKDFNELWKGSGPRTKKEKIKSASLFYVLNKTGFNGMFRLNSKGEFNIPIGDNTKIDISVEQFKVASSILSKTNIFNGSYEKILPPENKVNKKNSFIYLDPPYIPNSKTASFTDYSKEGFNEKDHENLADIFHGLVLDGYKVVLSNNLNNEAKSKYAKNKNVFAYEVLVSRSISKTVQDNQGNITRPKSRELLVSSFNLDSLGFIRI